MNSLAGPQEIAELSVLVVLGTLKAEKHILLVSIVTVFT